MIEMLLEDHRRLRVLLDRLDAEEDPFRARIDYLELVGELSAHEACEIEVVFPAIRAMVPSADHELAALLGEHEEMNELVDEMRGLDPSGLGFGKRESALFLELHSHFAEEEEVFDRLGTVLGLDERIELGRRACRAKCCAPAFPETESTGDRHGLHTPAGT